MRGTRSDGEMQSLSFQMEGLVGAVGIELYLPTRQVIESTHPRARTWGHLGPKSRQLCPQRFVGSHR